ncbi:MAG: ATP-grasp domain-containing protein [Xanthobacteraceae bacterium]
MGNEAAVLIVALSGRALAVSARRGGYLPLVADMFGDVDTLKAAHKHVRLTSGLAMGIEEQTLIDALQTLGQEQKPVGVVCGSGFEDRTLLLRRIAERWQLLGNSADVVARLKDPKVFSSICSDLDIPLPEISLSEPTTATGWLIKRQGGAGGAHIKPARKSAGAGGNVYYQRKVSGTPISASFLADGERALVLGFSAQWSSPTPRQPYRYGGAVQPAPLAPSAADKLTAVVHRIVAATSLMGLNSADFLVDGERFWLLEINPRPGATLDIFETKEASLFAQHVEACSGRLAAASGCPADAKAAGIVYAEDDIASFSVPDWPDWTADRPVAGSAFKAGEPLCTVYGCGFAAAGARALAEERRETVLSWTRARNS